MIEFRNVIKEYKNGVMALHGISLEIDKSDFVFVIGPSGAGKSTLLKMLYREELPNQGSIFINGVDITKLKKSKVPMLRRNLGVIFQDFKLLPNLTVYENVAFSLEVIGINKKNIRPRVLEVLDLVKLKNKAKYYPNQLSGGEQQRVAIARAIVNNPQFLICDEPTGNLDPETSMEIMDVLTKINEELGTTVVIATHDREIVNLMRKRVISIEYGLVVRDEVEGKYHYEKAN